MIRSMTGFARRERQGSWGTLACELRTVNHRYLEVSLRLPDELKTLDSDIRQAINNSLRRGKVDANLYLKNTTGVAPTFELNDEIVTHVIGKLTELKQKLGTKKLEGAPVDTMDLLRWPGVVRETERDLSPVLAAAIELTNEALIELNNMRAREGARIRELIKQRCDAMQNTAKTVRARLPEIAARIRSRVTERIAALGGLPDHDRLEQELVMYAHKIDVDEELDRLDSHLTEIASIIDSKEPAGRRLDFLMQELNREANTLSSKSQDVDTTRAAVDLKVLIEQMREQIQNIE
ncbi:MAG TPA: YicC/YloC family endoribonuclease [Steroidobacteraceae bacterium]|nr:YicC/YloC family endoribonuclease [Steroidobacteraceae bacterium]